MLILAGIALPTTKKLLIDQKASRASRSIAAYFAEARSEAIATGQFIGVRIERLAATNAVEFGSTASIRLQRIAGVPPYSGEASDATVEITAVDPATGIATLEFDSADNLLLTLIGQQNPPIQEGDLIEFPGGKTYPLDFTGVTATTVSAAIALNAPEFVKFDNPNLLELTDPTKVSGSAGFPLGHQVPSSGNFKYRIFRKPTVSSVNPLSFSRGIAIDLNYSGIGLGGNQFAPTDLTGGAVGDVNQPIDIFFGPDGRVEFASTDSEGNVGPATGMIYLCLGSTDGIVDPIGATVTLAELFQDDDQVTTNVMSLDSIWIVINPNTGRVVTAPFASINGPPAAIGTGLATARRLAILSDTLDAAP